MPANNMKHSNGNSSSRNADVSNSPLKIFVLAKKKIIDIFADVNGYVQETYDFLKTLSDDNVVNEVQIKEVYQLQDKIKSIKEVLIRDHMKVVFFGRTSNGKSSVVNAMLQDEILPSGQGHITNCFLQVEGSGSAEARVLTEDSSAPQTVESVLNLANALDSEQIEDNSLVRIFWPKDRCALLRDDVVLVDSPGIDVSPNLDEWIDKYCLDADIFVLVLNAESTLSRVEKNFFYKVSEKLSKPNIFILNNRWDAIHEKFLNKVRKQHMERNVRFLVDELKVVSRSQAENRVFFVSATEALKARLQQQNAGAVAEGFQKRFFEFQDFERKFQECLSKSALKTKFEQHTERGKTVTSDLRKLLESVYEKSTDLKSQKSTLRKEKCDKLEFTQKELLILAEEVKQQISNIVESVEHKVARALSEEICRLNVLVDEFERPFRSDNLVLSVYKKELNSHVEQGLGSNLKCRINNQVQTCVESAHKKMIDRTSSLITPEHSTKMDNILQRNGFEVFYRLNCENLCSDFQEDLEFRFSLGLVNIIKYFFNPNRSKKVLGKSSESVPWPIQSTHQTPSNEPMNNNVVSPTPEYLALLQKLALPSVSSETAVGILAVGSLLIKAVGWRIIVASLGVYGLLHAYERLAWTNKAKEKSFKKQYVDHITRKLRLIIDLTSANCSHQVQQELSGTFARLCNLVDEVISEMQNEISALDHDTQIWDESSVSARTLRNKADYLYSELQTFTEGYLQYDQSV